MKIIWYFTLILSCCLNQIVAQEASLSSGGDAQSSTGSVSYSIGQVLYNIQSSSEYFEIQGIQQPIEISVFTSSKSLNKELNILLFPNPVKEVLTIQLENAPNNLLAELFDSQGKLLIKEKITSFQTFIPTIQLLSNIYYLKISRNNNTMKTFKIIKQ